MGLTVRSVLPDAAAALRSLAAVGAIAVIAALWGPPGSAMSAVAVAAVAGATAFQDSPRSRIPLVYLVSGLCGVAVLLGTAVSGLPVLFVLLCALWCAGVAMLWAHGPNTGLIGAASGALMVAATSAGTPVSVGAALGTAALAVVGGLSQAVVLAVWPPQRWRAQRDAVVAAYRSLAADARRLADGRDDGWAVDTEPLVALREAFTDVSGPTLRRPAVYRGWYALPERIAATLTDMANGPRSEALSRVLEEAADTMAAVADTSRAGRIGTHVSIGRFDSVVTEIDGPESGTVRRLSALLHEVAAMRLGDFVPSTPDAVRLRRPELPTSVRSAMDTVRGHVNQDSPVLRHAVRVGAAVGLGGGIAQYAGIPYGYWIPLTALLVLRPETAHTYTRCVGRVAGTAAGVVVASAVLVPFAPAPVVSLGFAVVAVGIAYLVSGVGYIAMSGAVAAAAVFLLDVARAGTPSSLTDPLIATIAGGALAVIAHVALPDDELTRLAQRAGELLKTEIDYAATVIKGYVHERENATEEMTAAWQRVSRARSAFEATTGAMRLESRDFRLWLRSYRTAINSLTSSCTTLEAHMPTRPAGVDREFAITVDEFVEVLCGDPPTAASPWTVDAAELEAAAQRLREAAPRERAEDGSSRVLVAEATAITRSLTAVAISPVPISAR